MPTNRFRLAVALSVLAAVAVIASTTVGSDTFTEGAGTALTAHTPTIGTAWTEIVNTEPATITVNGGGGYVSATGGATSNVAIYAITPNPALSSANYDVSVAIVQTVTAQTDKDPVGIMGRLTDANNYYALGVDGDTSKTYALFKVVSGTVTVLSTGAITLSANDVLKLSMRGDTIKAYQNAAQLACAVDASLSSTGSAAMFWGFAGQPTWGSALGDVNTGWRLDDFLLVDFTGDGGDDNCAVGGGSATPRLLMMGVGK